MKNRKFGNTDLVVTPICFGAWEIGGDPFYKNQDEETSVSLVKSVIETGVNFLDTAPVYGFGISERLIGKAIKGIRERVVISTKCGLRWDSEMLSSIHTNATRKSILEEVDLSLKRLQTDYIDIYLLHWPDKDTGAPIGESVEALEMLKNNGKIRYWGVSNYNLEQLKEACRWGSGDCLQSHYSLLTHNLDRDILPYLVRNDIGFQAYSPLERGILTDRSIDDLKSQNEIAVNWILKGVDERKKKIVSDLKELSVSYSVPFASFAVACTVSRPGVTVLIVGTRNLDHLKDALRGAELEVSEEDLNRVSQIIQE